MSEFNYDKENILPALGQLVSMWPTSQYKKFTEQGFKKIYASKFFNNSSNIIEFDAGTIGIVIGFDMGCVSDSIIFQLLTHQGIVWISRYYVWNVS